MTKIHNASPGTDSREILQRSETRGINRRAFLQTAGACTLVGASSGLAVPFAWGAPTPEGTLPAEKTVWNSCLVNCGSRCPLKCHIETVNGKDVIRWLSTDDAQPDEFGKHQVRACLRGRSARRRIYNPDRLLYPMKRVGKRGEGKFERISWEEAIKTVGDKLKHTIDKYTNEAVYYQYGSGSTGYNFGGRNACQRLLKMMGGYLDYYGSYSTAQIGRALPFTYGAGYGRSLSREMSKAKLVVSFGYNPAETRMSGGGETYQYNEWRLKNNVRTIMIDPRYNDSTLGKEDLWIPIRPGTDAALVNAIAHVLITEKMVDEAFLEKYCVGYDEKTLPASAPANGHYKAYILGQGADGIAKTPQWASSITGIAADQIVQLAREIGTAKPAFITQGWGAQRQANGEQSARAIAMLGILTGNIGLPGTCVGDQPGTYSYKVPGYPALANPVAIKIPVFLWTDAITRGKEMTALADGVQGVDQLRQPIKFLWNYSSNTLINQHSDTGATHKILQDESLCEFIVVIDNHMTASARYADILLPDVTNFENSDIIAIGVNMGVIGGAYFLSPAIEPLGECKSAYQLCTELSRYLGIEQQFTEGKSYEDWLQEAYKKMLDSDAALPADLATARKMGIIKRFAPPEHGIALEKFRQAPADNPLKTPSGKIEIYSEQLAKLAADWKLPDGDVISALPQYAPTWEGAQDFETKKEFPLQCMGHHIRGRTHSTYHNIDLLRQADTDAVWINPLDAKPRGIKDGDMVHVASKRGVLQIRAKVTPRMMPGVVSMGQGAWYQPDAKGLDLGGCINTLTSLRPSPLAKGNPQHTNLVEVRLMG